MISEERALELTGLALQVEYGDFDKETMGRNYFTAEQYYPNRVVKRVGMGYIRDNTPEVHEKYMGMTETQAETDFIKVCHLYAICMQLTVLRWS